MSKYNFQVTYTATIFIQRPCEDDDEAEGIKESIEYGDFDLSEAMDGADVEFADIEVLLYGKNES